MGMYGLRLQNYEKFLKTRAHCHFYNLFFINIVFREATFDFGGC